jgi:NADPH:quinone reductase-like Zn-dependent oxidoreductase
MKAAIYTQYGPPTVVKIAEVPKPSPKSNEVLVKVHASTVNRTDTGFRSAEYVISRFWTGIFKPKHQVLGCEFSGVVEAVGSAVTEFKVGDRVFGFNDKTMGGHGEYLTLGAHEAITTMPENMDFVKAAALTEGSHYAWVDICAAKVQAGQEVMVYGATGAIGSAAVQLLKYVGAHVTAVCNTKNVELVRSLGADVVVDYQTQDFRQTQTRFDFIFDAVGKSSFKQCKPLLKKKGIYISTELGKNGENILLALTTPLWGGKRLLFPLPTISKADLIFIKELAEQGKFKPVIDRTYDLDQIVEAHTYAQSGQKTGNVVVRLV